jgi:hypothetical protein
LTVVRVAAVVALAITRTVVLIAVVASFLCFCHVLLYVVVVVVERKEIVEEALRGDNKGCGLSTHTFSC